MQADRMKPLAPWLEPFRSLPLTLLSLFMMVGAVDVLLAVQPALLNAMRGSWQGWTVSQGISAPWASLMAATVSVAGITIGAAILSGFIRVVQHEPFAWLAPVWVGACSLTLGRMPLVLPLPVSITLFASGSSLLLLGGASLIRTRDSLRVSAGLFLLVIPLLTLGAGYAQSTGEVAQRFGAHSGLLWFVLTSAAVGAGLIAFACSRSASTQPLDTDEISEQLVEMVERLSFSETRANQAEEQLAEMRRVSAAFSLRTDDFQAVQMRPQSGRPWQLWAALAFVLGCGASLYFASYLPLRSRLATELTRNREQNAQQALGVASLRGHFDAERAALIQQLTAARAALPAPAPAPDSSAASVGASAPVEAAPDANAGAEKSSRAGKTQHHAWTSHRGAAHATSRTGAHRGAVEASASDAAPAENTNEPAAPAKPASKHEPHDRAMSSSSNDPLEGLDGM